MLFKWMVGVSRTKDVHGYFTFLDWLALSIMKTISWLLVHFSKYYQKLYVCWQILVSQSSHSGSKSPDCDHVPESYIYLQAIIIEVSPFAGFHVDLLLEQVHDWSFLITLSLISQCLHLIFSSFQVEGSTKNYLALTHTFITGLLNQETFQQIAEIKVRDLIFGRHSRECHSNVRGGKSR